MRPRLLLGLAMAVLTLAAGLLGPSEGGRAKHGPGRSTKPQFLHRGFHEGPGRKTRAGAGPADLEAEAAEMIPKRDGQLVD